MPPFSPSQGSAAQITLPGNPGQAGIQVLPIPLDVATEPLIFPGLATVKWR
jgi:hypothetical protein